MILSPFLVRYRASYHSAAPRTAPILPGKGKIPKTLHMKLEYKSLAICILCINQTDLTNMEPELLQLKMLVTFHSTFQPDLANVGDGDDLEKHPEWVGRTCKSLSPQETVSIILTIHLLLPLLCRRVNLEPCRLPTGSF